MTQTVLIVEDEVGLAEILRDYLHVAGFASEIISEGIGVVEWVKLNSPALILLDLMLSGKDGMEICKEIRTFSNVPIIITTARIEEIDRLLGLELGADDYVCKPYSPREVVARVKAIMRRIRSKVEAETAPSGPIVLDEDRFKVFIYNEPVEITPVEFRLFQVFLTNPGCVFTRTQLMDRAYPDGRLVSDRTVDTHIKNLRKKIHERLKGEEVIHSVYGVGYRFEYT